MKGWSVWAGVLGFAILLGSAAKAETDEERTRIAILPVVVHSADSRGYLRAGLADMLTSRLEQIDTLEVIRIDDVDQATTRASQAREIGKAQGADYVLFGSFTRFGEGASLDMQCVAVEEEDSEGAPERQIFVQSGNIGNVIPDLDNLVGKVSRFAGAGGLVPSAGAAPPPGEDAANLASLLLRVEALEAALRAQGIDTQVAPTTGGAPTGPAAGPALPPPPAPAPEIPEP